MVPDSLISSDGMVSTLQPFCPKLPPLNSNTMQPLLPVESLTKSHGCKGEPEKPVPEFMMISCNRKRVRFEEYHNAVIPQEEGQHFTFFPWYNPEEYRSFQMEARNTILAYFQVGNDPFQLDPAEHCLRGLEKHQFPPRFRAILKAQNKQFINLIIGEYSRLREARVADVERKLHDMSTLYTNPAKVYAMHLALLDC
jgi:hypothetical protein